MTTTIRGKSGKETLVALLRQHDECQDNIEYSKTLVDPITLSDSTKCISTVTITCEELLQVLQARLQVINTKLENLGLKIGDEVMENAQ